MRPLFTILMGALLVFSQAFAVASPRLVEVAGPCRCCSCGAQSCCLQETSPAPTPAPFAPQRVQVSTESIVLIAPQLFTVTTPFLSLFDACAPDRVAWLSAIPLFRRDCALRI